MPPKPFKPPRPSGSGLGTTPSNGRPRKSGTSIPSTSKAKTTSTGISKSKSSTSKRLSARDIGLPSLSPDSDDPSSASPSHSQTAEESDDPFASQPVVPKSKKRQSGGKGVDMDMDMDGGRNRDVVGIDEDADGEEGDERREGIPPDLLSVLLHQMFRKEGTRMSKGANAAVGKYMETFVREGVARCVWAGAERRGEGGVVEVEDLEKLAPQLLLDF
ncbi:Centromere protein X [Lachnellula hyalina]|uniref:Centromere protein X n=1 Tax=Lachnellula hyalina TaxID=1316788 RepID=A0A8H8R0B5_9HELO|nr:Centromere protein X [Lachnellula hyalina]TVY25741.1 Centromere protein X [Lachnellula hyalina]